jgi:hypothetical protein
MAPLEPFKALFGPPRLNVACVDGIWYIFDTRNECRNKEGYSGTKLTISASRNRLGEDIIEATECLNRWHKAGI